MSSLHALRSPGAAVGSCGASQRAVAAVPTRHRPRVGHSLPQQQHCAQQLLQPQQRQQSQTQRHQQQGGRGQLLQRRAGPVDAPPVWTLDQIAGLAFGAVMLAFYFGSQQVDVIIAKQQRKQLGLCESCGGLNDPATCSKDGCPMRAASAK